MMGTMATQSHATGLHCMSRIDKIVVFDVESTGVDVFEDRIVTAFIGVMLPDGTFEDKWSYLINPGIDIPEGASDIHGITTEKAQAEGIDAKDGIFSILQRLDILDRQNLLLVAYNASYDLSTLKAEAERYGFRPYEPKFVVDPFVIDKQIDKYRRGKRTLTVTAAHYGIDIENAHNAEDDCIAAGKLAFALINVHLPAVYNRTTLHQAQIGWAKEQAAGLEKHFRKTDDSVRIDGTWPIRSKAAA